MGEEIYENSTNNVREEGRYTFGFRLMVQFRMNPKAPAFTLCSVLCSVPKDTSTSIHLEFKGLK